ncbi:MAG: SMC-Scp complex subunit ScpB [Candidatus Buchananbacteria bacterium]|jgi:segregation and condensation protein B
MLKNKIESLLFISHKPLSVTELAKLTDSDKPVMENALMELTIEYKEKAGGVELLKLEDKYQLATTAENAELISKFLNTEVTGELSRPSLETLTIIAYRGPISKVELELIRGVNCSLIIRNLLMRGLIESAEDKVRATMVYSITFEFLKHLGLNAISELPDFDRLNRNNNLEKLLQGLSGGAVEKDIKDDMDVIV